MNAGEIAAPETVLQVTSIDQTSRAELARALDVLHRGPGLLVRAAGLMGGVMSRTMTAGARTIGFAPGLEDQMRAISAAALRRAFDISVLGLASAPGVAVDAIGRRRNASRAVVTISGAVGGFPRHGRVRARRNGDDAGYHARDCPDRAARGRISG